MSKSLKDKAISGMIWNGIERFGSSLFLFISNIILARLLSPDDFGCIGMLLVFTSISEAIVDGGFGSALIQKKNPTPTDYSTVFYWNIVLSILLYAVLCFSSPFIAVFYKIPLLSDVLRVQGSILVINAFFLIQQNVLKKQIAFKKIAKINMSAIIAGTSVGILFAFLGFGVWSLVIKSIVTGIIQCIVYWICNNWRPQWLFSWSSFNSLFKFGSFIFLTNVVNTLFHNLLSLIIGKSFSAATLGYFTQAKKLEEIPRNTISAVVTNVSFSVFSQIQDDKARLCAVIRKCLKSMMYINVPTMMLLIVLADALITVLFTSKWEKATPYFQVLCIYGMFTSPIDLNRWVINAIGKSQMSFYIMIVQRLLGLILVVWGLHWGMKGILIGFVTSQFAGYIISAAILSKQVGYRLIKQCWDLIPILLLSSIIAVFVYIVPSFLSDISPIWVLSLQTIIFISMYLFLSIVFKVEGYEPYLSLLKSKRQT